MKSNHTAKKSGFAFINNRRFQVVALMVVWFAIGWLACTWFTSATNPEANLFGQALSNIENKAYAAAPSRQDLTYTAIRAMLSSLGDRYATFRDPALANRAMQELEGVGEAVIGIEGEMKDGQFFITALTPDLPAAQSGLQVGDVITSVDGWTVKPSTTSSEVFSMVRNNQIPTAHITVTRGSQALTFDIPRQAVQAVTSKMIGRVAYLRYDIEDATAPQALKTELERLMQSNPKGLILDLRYNGGGLMDATQKILDLFEGEGVAFYARSRDGKLMTFATKNGDIAEQIPMVVLVAKETYSAAETIAASLQERGRAVLLGATTHGKGSIVETVQLSDGSSFQLTVARWLSPVQQKDYEGLGVTPNASPVLESSSVTDTLLDFAVATLDPNK